MEATVRMVPLGFCPLITTFRSENRRELDNQLREVIQEVALFAPTASVPTLNLVCLGFYDR